MIAAALRPAFAAFCLLATGLAAADPSLQLTLPPHWHAVAGVPVRLYFDNVVLTETPEAFEFEVSGLPGRQEARCWTLTPTEAQAGAHVLEVRVKNRAGKLLEQARTTLHIAPGQAGAGRKLRLLVVGDSLTHASLYPNEIARLLAEPGNPQVTFLGTHRPAAVRPGVAHEGYGGWKWADFLTKFAPEPAGVTAGPKARKTTSPFIYPDAAGRGRLDLPRYWREQPGGAPPDVVTFLLGINDCFGANPEDPAAMDRTIDGVLDQAEKLLAAFRAAAPEAVLAVGLTTPPNARESGFQANYQGRYHRWGWKRIQHRLVQRMIARLGGREAERIHLVATELHLDPVDGYPVNNGVHPNPAGYAQIGVSFYGWLKNWLAAAR